MERNLTTGSVGKNILLFSLPYLLSYFLQTLYGMADLFIIGQFDEVASTTAVSIGSQVMHMLTVMLVGLAMGTVPAPLTASVNSWMVSGPISRPIQSAGIALVGTTLRAQSAAETINRFRKASATL